MKRYKLSKSPEQICSQDARCRSLVPFFREAYSYGFSDQPGYGVLIFLLERQILDLSGIPDRCFSWRQLRGFHGRNVIQDDRQISPEPPEANDECQEGDTSLNLVRHCEVQAAGPKLEGGRRRNYWEVEEFKALPDLSPERPQEAAGGVDFEKSGGERHDDYNEPIIDCIPDK